MCGSSCVGCAAKNDKAVRRTAFRKKEARFKTVILWAGVLTLLVAYIYGKVTNRADYMAVFQEYYPAGDIDQLDHDLFVIRKSDTLLAHLRISANNGYGGPLKVGVKIKPDTTIGEVVVISEKETQSFFNKLVKNDFFKQFEGLLVTDRFQPGENIDGVSGATVSSVAFTNAIQKAAHKFAKEEYGIADLSPAPVIKFGFGEIAMLGLLVWSVALYFKKNKRLLYLMHLTALVVIGFYLNLSLSITNFGSVLLGYFPNVHDHLVWYISVVIVLTAALVFGKNIYCYRICPFYAVQWLANRISGINISLSPQAGETARYVAGVLLWLSLLVGFLTATPSSGSYEPFATLFAFEGEGIQWFILPAVFFSSYFIKEVFCRYYCPVGGFLKFVIINVRKPIVKQIKLWQNSKAEQVTS